MRALGIRGEGPFDLFSATAATPAPVSPVGLTPAPAPVPAAAPAAPPIDLVSSMRALMERKDMKDRADG